jgi:hypothetical protein
MAIFKIPGSAIQPNTITTTQLSSAITTQISAGGGPRVSSLIYPGNDTAGNTVGGQTVFINGSGFETNNAIYINGNSVPSKSFISASNLSFTTPALSAGIYPVYVINTDSGSTAIFIPGYISSAEPAWVTSAGSLAASQDEATAWSYSLSATGDAPITYALAVDSSLPSGISLAANGLISGTLSSPPGTDTTYTFSVVATDAQNQDSTRQFTVTTNSGEGVLFANNVLLIHADGTNNKNNHTFLDSSNNNFTITRNGNATQGSFSPFSQTGWSNFFDGTGDYLTVPDNLNLRMGSSAFDKGYTAADGLLFQTGNGDGRTVIYAGGSSILTSNTAVTTNTWTHVALVRNASTMTLYQNGISVGSGSNSTNFSNTSIMGVGANATGGGGNVYAINGYLSNFRVVKDTAVYTANFTPSAAPLTAVSNTSLLTCQSNRFRDASNNNFTITRNGDTSIQPFSPFAPTAKYSTANVGGSGYFDGTGDRISVGGNAAFDISSGNFTVEGWIYPTSSSGVQGLFVLFTATNSDYAGMTLYVSRQSSSVITVEGASPSIGSGGSAIAITTTNTAPVNTWTHIAITRNSNTFTVWVNGVSSGTATFSGTLYWSPPNLYIGAGNDTTPNQFAGYISDVRIVKGTAVYTSAFTPPTAPLTNIANTSLLCNFTNAGIFDQTAKTALETLGDAKVSTAQYKYGTGSIAFDGTGDYLKTPNNAILTFGTGDLTLECWIYQTATSTSTYRVIFGDNVYGSTGGYTLYSYNNALNLWKGSGGGGAEVIAPAGTITLNTWTHVAWTRSGSSNRLFINGTQVGSTTTDATNYTSTASFIGASQSGTLPFAGYIDDLRITKGYARYTSNFTPPSSAFKDR